MNGNKWALAILTLVLISFLCVSHHAAMLASAASQLSHRAGLVIQFGDGSHITRCISFTGDSISGLELLMRSGLDVVTWGGAVCRIEQYGCEHPAEPCFCQCKGAKCLYWSYWHWREGRWVYSSVGSADYLVRDGDIEGWAWSNGQPPPVVSIDQVCSPHSTATASQTARQVSQSAMLLQYAAFVFMTVVLASGFLFLQKHRWER